MKASHWVETCQIVKIQKKTFELLILLDLNSLTILCVVYYVTFFLG